MGCLIAGACWLSLIPLEYFLEGFLFVEEEIENPAALAVMAGEPEIRLPVAAGLCDKYARAVILVANDGVKGRWSKEQHKNLSNAEWSAQYLYSRGVAKERVVILPFSRCGTIHDVSQIKDYALSNKIEKVLFVTSDYHARRTLAAAKIAMGGEIKSGVYPAWSDAGLGTLVEEFAKVLIYRLLPEHP